MLRIDESARSSRASDDGSKLAYGRIFQVWRRLFDEGVITRPVLPPPVPAGTALIRTSCMATHTIDQLDQALDAFSRVGREMELI